MKYIFIASVLLLFTAGCKDNTDKDQDSPAKSVEGNVILHFAKDQEDVDSVKIESKGKSYTETQNFSTAMGFDTPQPLPADLYTFSIYRSSSIRKKIAWLDGTDVKVYLGAREFNLDSIANSPLYDEVQDFSDAYKSYTQSGYSLEKTRSFLWRYMKTNRGNPFSLLVTQLYWRQNLKEKENLNKALAFLDKQGDSLQNHPMNPRDKIEHQLRKLSKE